MARPSPHEPAPHQRVELDVPGGAVHVWLQRAADAPGECPECHTAQTIYDHREHAVVGFNCEPLARHRTPGRCAIVTAPRAPSATEANVVSSPSPTRGRTMAPVLLDDVDKELEQRGLGFVRYADDLNVHVRSKRAGEDALQTLRRP